MLPKILDDDRKLVLPVSFRCGEAYYSWHAYFHAQNQEMYIKLVVEYSEALDLLTAYSVYKELPRKTRLVLKRW